jgi:hypothetical protein
VRNLARTIAFGVTRGNQNSTRDNDNDDDARPSALASSVGEWAVGRGCASGLLPFRLVPPLPPITTATKPSVSSPGDSTVEGEVPLTGRNRDGTVFVTAVASVAGGIASLCVISHHHSTNLRRNRALRSSRGPEPPSLFGPFPTAISLLLASPEEQRRRDAGRKCGKGGGGSPIVTPGGASGTFPFVPPRCGGPHRLPYTVVSSSFSYPLCTSLCQPCFTVS